MLLQEQQQQQLVSFNRGSKTEPRNGGNKYFETVAAQILSLLKSHLDSADTVE